MIKIQFSSRTTLDTFELPLNNRFGSFQMSDVLW